MRFAREAGGLGSGLLGPSACGACSCAPGPGALATVTLLTAAFTQLVTPAEACSTVAFVVSLPALVKPWQADVRLHR